MHLLLHLRGHIERAAVVHLLLHLRGHIERAAVVHLLLHLRAHTERAAVVHLLLHLNVNVISFAEVDESKFSHRPKAHARHAPVANSNYLSNYVYATGQHAHRTRLHLCSCV